MKRSLRLPFSLFLLLLAFLTLLSSRSSLRRNFGSGFYLSPPTNNPRLNQTLIHLASIDSTESQLKREVEDLIDGNLPSSSSPSKSARQISLWRRENHIRLGSATRLPIRLRTPKDYRNFPEFRRALRDWFRLRGFNPQVMSDLARSVKYPITRSLSPYDSCAVVGNSGILLKSEYGDLIDSHDVVIRLNNARIQGYTHHVGSKTNISFVNSNILHLCARRDGCFCHPYGDSVAMVMYICQPVHFLDYATCNSSHKAPLVVTDARFDVLCARIVKYYSLKRFVEETGRDGGEWGKKHDEKMFHYSSGMQAVLMAAGVCRKVSVFGFGKSTEAKHHYHTNQKAELDLHDYEAEYAFYGDLVERPEEIPFLMDSGFKVPPVVFYH